MTYIPSLGDRVVALRRPDACQVPMHDHPMEPSRGWAECVGAEQIFRIADSGRPPSFDPDRAHSSDPDRAHPRQRLAGPAPGESIGRGGWLQNGVAVTAPQRLILYGAATNRSKGGRGWHRR
jgi:hypothetical protein